MRIFNLLKDICKKVGLIDDYIVEHGTKGVWTYRKWDSGIVECWGANTFTPTALTAWGTAYYCEAKPVSYPFTFKSKPFEVSQVSSSAGSYYIAPQNNNTTSKTAGAYCVRPMGLSDPGKYSVTINYLVKGRWK